MKRFAKITMVVEIGSAWRSPPDKGETDFIFNDMLKEESLYLHSNEIGDEVGKVHLVELGEVIWRPIDFKKSTRDDIVPHYVELIKSDPSDEQVIWMNREIISRWSNSALEYIKDRAWKIN